MRRSALTLIALSLLAVEARADRRNFPFTYEAVTLPKGEAEIEQYLTTRALRLGRDDTVLDWQYQLEVEYGLTDTIDLGVYQMFGQGPGEPLSWQGYKLRGRWRPVDYGAWFVDPLLYLELIQRADGRIALEEKLVVGLRTDYIVSSFNLTLEQSGLNRDAQELELAPSLGVGYTPADWVTIGAEALATFSWELGEAGTHAADPAYYAGPAISLAGSRAWVAASALWQIGDAAHDTYRVRLLLGLDL